ncbi:Asp23/Gls24 family envelope stress response protein [Plantibacter sp. VKM Ac-2885]|uniref:Asp23/Gls24 family envelope stress response protein n=1 Tax=Plantibacter sp. VKM Ac-2885 TaxID=2783828 RepID=UPI00188D1D12|nr:Asp23/Gls24 family envelope stress response protein [Plantibacter sp. VKM Ac-2885]MBF4513578.1 Asp23/Gls24 family envelope stress response protein [Plantibacter sp. VKM Ac-2885]
MSDDTKHPDQHHIPTPAEVRAEHPTVLVPAHPDDEVRRIESHDGEHAGGTAPAPVVAPANGAVAGPEAAEPAVADSVSAETPTVTVSEPVASPEPADAPVVELDSGRRREQEADELAQVIATTAETVPGVHALGSPTARAIDSARTRLLGRTAVPGVNVLADDDVLNVEVSLVAEYPASIDEVADTVRADVAAALEARHPGPVDIDIRVTDIHGPFDPIEPDPGEAIDDAKAAIGNATSAAGAAIGDAAEAAGDALGTAKAAASDAVDSARAGAADLADAAGDAVEQRTDRSEGDDGRSLENEQPGAAAGADGELVADGDVAGEPIDAVVSEPSDDVSEELAEAARQLATAADSLATVAEEVTHGADPNLADAEPLGAADAIHDAPAEEPAATSADADLVSAPEQDGGAAAPVDGVPEALEPVDEDTQDQPAPKVADVTEVADGADASAEATAVQAAAPTKEQ